MHATKNEYEGTKEIGSMRGWLVDWTRDSTQGTNTFSEWKDLT